MALFYHHGFDPLYSSAFRTPFAPFDHRYNAFGSAPTWSDLAFHQHHHHLTLDDLFDDEPLFHVRHIAPRTFRRAPQHIHSCASCQCVKTTAEAANEPKEKEAAPKEQSKVVADRPRSSPLSLFRKNRVELKEEGNKLIVTASLPDCSPADINLTFEGDALKLHCERKSTDNGVHFSERFERRIPLPRGVDEKSITADFANGELVVSVVKPEERATKRINIGQETAPATPTEAETTKPECCTAECTSECCTAEAKCCAAPAPAAEAEAAQ